MGGFESAVETRYLLEMPSRSAALVKSVAMDGRF
jgi:hypothetical protein